MRFPRRRATPRLEVRPVRPPLAAEPREAHCGSCGWEGRDRHARLPGMCAASDLGAQVMSKPWTRQQKVIFFGVSAMVLWALGVIAAVSLWQVFAHV